MNKARHLILRLYKNDNLTEEEVNILLDGIENKNNYYTQPVHLTNADWTYRPNKYNSPTIPTETYK